MDQTPELPPHLRNNAPNDDDSDEYCPQLPPNLSNKNSEDSSSPISQSSKNITSQSTASSNADRNYCPALPPHLIKQNNDNAAEDSDESEDSFCPALPPHLMKKEEKVYGAPMPPAGYGAKESVEESDDDDAYGPMPAPQPLDIDEHYEKVFMERNQRMTDRLNEQKAPKKLERESWMLELPEDRPLAGLGLQARQFRRSAKRDRGDTSVWTDTPADKEKKEKKERERKGAKDDEKEELVTPESIAAKNRDEKLQKFVDDYNTKKRSAPLIDTHLTIKKQKPDDNLSVTGEGIHRKPFSREDDLSVNKFDEVQKSTILKKARQLNDRFSAGKSKFL